MGLNLPTALLPGDSLADAGDEGLGGELGAEDFVGAVGALRSVIYAQAICRHSLDDEVLCLRVMDDEGVGTLFGLEVVALGEADADVLLGLEELKDLGLVFEVGAGGVAEGVARAAVLLVEEVFDVGGVFGVDSKVDAHLFVHVFGEGFGGFDGETVEVEVSGEVAGLEELLGDLAGAAADGDDGEADDVMRAGEPSSGDLGEKKSAMESRRPSRWRGKLMRSSSLLCAGSPEATDSGS